MAYWRPRITKHAAGRYLERVLGVLPPWPDEPLELQLSAMMGDMTMGELVEAIWPSTVRLTVDPGCRFVLRRDGFKYCVERGRLLTILPATDLLKGHRFEHNQPERARELI